MRIHTHLAHPNRDFINPGLLGWLLLFTLLLAACDIRKPNYPREQGVPLTVTLSSDGQLLAVLDHDSKSERRLRIKWLNNDEPWQALPLTTPPALPAAPRAP